MIKRTPFQELRAHTVGAMYQFRYSIRREMIYFTHYFGDATGNLYIKRREWGRGHTT